MNQKLDLQKQSQEQFELKDLFKIIYSYKILITFITLVALFLSSVYLFFKPSVYSTHAIIELKTQNAKNRQIAGDDFLQTALTTHNEEIEKEIEILRTFNVNQKVLEKINLKTQFFVQEPYKKSEIFINIPINIDSIKILDKEIIGKMFVLIPEEDGFYLEFEHSLRDKITAFVVNKKLKKFKVREKIAYNTLVKTEFLELKISKLNSFNHKIYFRINGTKQEIYENIVKNKLHVEQLNKNASLVKIVYEDTIPQRATNYVNTLVKVFLERGRTNKSKQNNQILEFMETRLKETKMKLDKSEKLLENYTIKNKIIEPSLEAGTLRKELSNIEIQLYENLLKENLIDNVLTFIRQNMQLDAVAPTLAEFNDNATLNLVTELQRAQLEAQTLEAKYTDNYPELASVHARIHSLEKKILLNIKNLKSTINNKVKTLKGLKATYEKKLLILPQKEKRLIDLQRDYDVNSKMYDYLLNKKEEKEIIKAATVSDYDIIEYSYIPNQPIKPRKPLILLVSIMIGLILGVLLSLLHNNVRSLIKRKEDIYNNTFLDLHSIVPFVKNEQHEVDVFNHPQSSFSESFRKLRTDLQFISSDEGSKVILVTSTVLNEGKTTLVANLGAIFQLSGFKSIMIDLDLHQPDLHNFYDIDYQVGMSSYLSGEANISDVIFSTEYPNLDIIPVGSLPSNPSELILTSRLPRLFEKLRENYDYIFIDTTSVGTLTDTINIMKYADVNLFVLRKDYAKRSFITRLEKIMEKYNLKNIGLVFNGSSEYKN